MSVDNAAVGPVVISVKFGGFAGNPFPSCNTVVDTGVYSHSKTVSEPCLCYREPSYNAKKQPSMPMKMVEWKMRAANELRDFH